MTDPQQFHEPLDAGDEDEGEDLAMKAELVELHQLNELAPLSDDEREQLARLRRITTAAP